MNENVENTNAALQFLKSKDNFDDMFTKPGGPIFILVTICDGWQTNTQSSEDGEDHRP